MSIPEGFKLVPVEPTEAMHDAARDWSIQRYGKAIGSDASRGCYSVMLAAAPTPPQPIYDEAKERELFAEFSRRIIAHDAENFPIRWCDCVPDEAIEDHLNTWLACAQPRPKSVEVDHE